MLRALLCCLILHFSCFAFAQASPGLLDYINSIHAIDNHAHPPAATKPGDPEDPEVDALKVESFEASPFPARLDLSLNPEFLQASRAVFNYPFADYAPEHMEALKKLRLEARQAAGDKYPEWVLDKMNVETMLANRPKLGVGQAPPRYRWVPFVDSLLFPLNNSVAKSSNAERAKLFRDMEVLRTQYWQERGFKAPPPTLLAYLHDVIDPVMERMKRQGAVAVKFEVAYLRKLDFTPVREDLAAEFYRLYLNSSTPDPHQYKLLQDFLFHYVCERAGKLGLVVHIHVLGGLGSFYDIAGAEPILLEPTFNDPSLRSTKFVVLHGGWPWTQETAALLAKPNVYTDFSFLDLQHSPEALSRILEEWIELYPDKVLFATDSGPFVEGLDWAEVGMAINTTARKGLALALTRMQQSGAISNDRAREIALMVMRKNAETLYGFGAQQH